MIKLITMARFTKSVWTYKLGILFMESDKILVLGGFYFGHTEPVTRFDKNKYWYCYIYLPCITVEGKAIKKIGFTTDRHYNE